jgi:hypothetical protein
LLISFLVTVQFFESNVVKAPLHLSCFLATLLTQ